MRDILLFCSHCNTVSKTEPNLEKRYLAPFIDNDLCITQSTSKDLIEKVNAMPKNLQLILENVDANGKLAFLDKNICVSNANRLSRKWCCKPTDTSTILNFRSFAHCDIRKI